MSVQFARTDKPSCSFICLFCGSESGKRRERKEREREEEEMTLCLYECLRAVGLQCHYARFTSVGVRRVAHLSGLTMEDYHNLGVRSMEDRTRLFHLVQMVKTLDLESLEYEDRDDDDDNDYDHGDEGYAIADSSITYDGCGEPDEDKYDDVDEKGDAVSSFSKPSRVRRRLDFSCETSDHHQKLLPLPVGTVHVYTSHNRNNEPGQSKGSAISVQLELDTEGPVVCSCKGNNNHRSDVHSHQSDHRTGANSKPDIVEGISINNSHTRLSPKCVSSHRPKPRPATVASNSFSNKLNGYKDRKGISRKENLYAEISRNTASEHTTKATPVYESKTTAGYNYGLPLSSPPSPNKKQPDGQRISVCVRKRPLTQGECRRGEADVVTTPSGECVTVHESKEAVDLTQYILQHRFYFDQVFGEESSNEEVYRKTAYPLVQHMLNGGKATCFAYGQTGAGKTHTMLGSSPGRPGLYALAVRDIFAQLSTTRTHSPLLVYVSFFEIYCGQLYDLLDHRKRLFAREDGQKVVHIAGLQHVRVDSVSSLLEVISHGTEERTQGMSGVNPLSSRSHALLQIQLRGSNQQIAGRMWFVDLAGSERASDTKEPDRQSRMEGAEINQSLLALKECIRSLDQEQLHTPFRQSKLTQVLKDSFIGDSMTCMIANISPGHLATEHTLNTLRYADRVKELRGSGGLRGGRRGKTIPSPKCNLSNGNSSRGGSSVGTRGKSPPKKPKLGRQKEAFSPTTLTSRLATEGAVLCSTPKKDRWGEETGAIARNGFGIEQITPIRGSLGTGDKRERADGRITRRRGKYGGTESEGDQNVRARPGEQLHLWEVPRESGFYHRERENQQSTSGKMDERAIGGLEAERRWIEQRRQVESSTDTCSDVERLRERDLQKVESDNERVRHLRQYHQQLQQFMPSSASSSDHLFSPSACQSFSSSNQASLSPSSSSSLQHSSSISVSALMCHGLEDVLGAHGVARVEVRTDAFRGQSSSSSSGEICLQTGTSPSYNKNNDEVDHGDSGGVSEDWRVSQEGTEAGFGHDRGKREKRRSQKARGEGEVRVKREDWRSAKMEGGGEGRWAWMPTTGTDRVTGARPADVETSMSGNCDSDVGEEGLEASNVPSDTLWSTEEQEEADSYDLVPTHSNNNSNSLFNHPPVESTHQRAPAERPLSPPCEHTNTLLTPNKLSEHTRRTSNILPLPLRNVQQGVPSSSPKEKEPWFATNANRREYFSSQSTTLPLSTPITQNGRKIPAEPLNILSENPAHTHSHPQVKSKMSVLAQEDISTDSLSYIMDPLSISLLDVDRQVATASFLQGEQNTSLCLLEYEKEEDKRRDAEKEHLTCAKMANKNVENEDMEFRLSLLELPQAETRYSPMSETMAATNSEPRKDLCFATYEHCGIGTMKTPISEVMLASLQDHDNNQKLQTTPDIEVLDNKGSASVQHPERTGSPSSHNLPPEYAHNVPNSLAFSISTPQSESVPGQLNTLPKHCHTVHSNQCKNSNIALQPTVPTDLKSEEGTSKMQIRPIIHLSMLEDLYHDQWRVVQAHWEQLEEMESLCRKEGTLLCQQPDMAFGEYVHKLGEIMERKARCVHSMIAQLQPYLKTSHINKPHNQAEDNHDQIT